MFHQLEGLYIDEKVSVRDLKYCLETLLKTFFDDSFKKDLGPVIFWFTEPSFEVDIAFNDNDDEWMEVLGAGMVHKNVFRSVSYDQQKLVWFCIWIGD